MFLCLFMKSARQSNQSLLCTTSILSVAESGLEGCLILRTTEASLDASPVLPCINSLQNVPTDLLYASSWFDPLMWRSCLFRLCLALDRVHTGCTDLLLSTQFRPESLSSLSINSGIMIARWPETETGEFQVKKYGVDLDSQTTARWLKISSRPTAQFRRFKDERLHRSSGEAIEFHRFVPLLGSHHAGEEGLLNSHGSRQDACLSRHPFWRIRALHFNSLMVYA